jgi:hypothetical protein
MIPLWRKKKRSYLRKKATEMKYESEFQLGTNNRLVYIYTKVDKKIKSIISVSLSVKIKNEWITILYYDNYHAEQLHRHTKIKYNSSEFITDYQDIEKKDDTALLLEWAIKDIVSHYLEYKKRFLEQSKKFLKNRDIDEF